MKEGKLHVLVMSFGSDAGGIEKSLIEFLKFLLSQDYSVDLFLWRKPGALYNQIPNKVNILTPKIYPGRFIIKKPKDWIWYITYRLYLSLKIPTKCFAKFPDNNYDIAISYCQNGYSPHYVIDKVKADKKILFYHHGSYDEKGRQKRLDYRCYLKYDKFVAVSQSAKEMLSNHFPKLADKICVVNNLVDDTHIINLSKSKCPINENRKRFEICTVGRLSPEKGQRTALEAAKRLKESGLKFRWWFVGDGSDMEYCRSFIADNNLSDCCILAGLQTNPYPFMRCCDLYVQPSKVEADPITIREARILGKRILATNISALQDALSDYEYGSVCQNDSISMSSSIINILSKSDCPELQYQPGSINLNAIKGLRSLLS